METVFWAIDDAAAGAAKLFEVVKGAWTWERMAAAARQRYQSLFAPEVLGRRWVTAISADFLEDAPPTASSAYRGINTT